MKTTVLALLAAVTTASAIQINFVNNCAEPVWAAVGAVPNGKPNPAIAWGKKLAAHGGKDGFHVDDKALGVRAWGRTGCDASGNGCKTGGCKGGMVCTDAGITSNVILSEYGYGNFGAQYGGERTAWDISRAGLGSNLLPINLDTKVSSSDGQSVQCTKAHCPDDQAYLSTNDYKADRNSPLGRTYVHTFCP